MMIMAISEFEIREKEVIKLAKCDNVPKVMIIAGPNGVGKSTLLYYLWSYYRDLWSRDKHPSDPYRTIFYIPAHRGYRKSRITMQMLYDKELKYRDFLKNPELPPKVGGFGGLDIRDKSRIRDSADEAQYLIKFVISQIKTKYDQKLSKFLEKRKFIYPEGKAPDIFKPLKEFTSFLLGHLNLVRVDMEERNNVKILFSTVYGNNLVDFDSLSSGEKEIISLFLVLIEYEMEKILNSSFETNEIPTDTEEEITMVIDEPDLHIHPSLQIKILEYMRRKAEEDNIHFIIATHSPIFINNATNDELYALVPPSGENENQLHQVISDEERQNLFKEIYGDLTLLTLGKPVILLEGRAPEASKISDQKILETLTDLAKDFIFIPVGGKSEVKGGIAGLSKILEEQPAGYKIFAIVDRDYELKGDEEEQIFKWPFCTIENALLDIDAIANVLRPHINVEFEELREEITKSFNDIFIAMVNNEIGGRIEKLLRPIFFGFRGCSSYDEVVNKIEEAKKIITEIELKNKHLKRSVSVIKNEVEQIVKGGKAYTEFDGKEILVKFHQKFVRGKKINVGFYEFCNHVAYEIRKLDKCPQAITDLLSEIKSKLS